MSEVSSRTLKIGLDRVNSILSFQNTYYCELIQIATLHPEIYYNNKDLVWDIQKQKWTLLMQITGKMLLFSKT